MASCYQNDNNSLRTIIYDVQGSLRDSECSGMTDDGGCVVEIGGKGHTAERPSSKPESAVVDALADALLRVRSRSGH
jgi:hypothetical protein